MNMKLNIVLFLLIFFTYSCSTNKKASDFKIDPKADFNKGNIKNQGLDIAINSESDAHNAGELATVHFDLNASTIGVHLISDLNKNIDYLKSHLNFRIRIEGHCDERGSRQFNLSLGEKRARFVQDYLIAKGINGNRVEIISIGKERPVSYGHSEESWSLNRRANFVIIEILNNNKA